MEVARLGLWPLGRPRASGPPRPGARAALSHVQAGSGWASLATRPVARCASGPAARAAPRLLPWRVRDGFEPSWTARKMTLVRSASSKNCFASISAYKKDWGTAGASRPNLRGAAARFLHSFSTTQTGEALSAHTLHHRHHTVVLSIPSTTPLYLAGPGRRSRWCDVRVHLLEASPLAALDWIGSRGGEG
jgi:hypothetical protein